MELNIAWKISKTGSSHCGSVGWIPNTVSVRMWVRSLASLSELRIWHCHKVQCRSQAQLGSEAPIQPSNLGNFHMLQVQLKKKKKKSGSSHCSSRSLQTQLLSMRMRVQSLVSLSGLRFWCCGELWCRSETWFRSHITIWRRVAAAAPIWPLAWKLPYVIGAALKSKNKQPT